MAPEKSVEQFVTERDGREGMVLSWASLLEDNTREQAEMISRAAVVEGHVALMPDAHLGMGACVGSAIKTRGGILPSAVGVDIGCGMRAVQTDLSAESLDRAARGRIIGRFREWIPAGVGQGREPGSPLDKTYQAWQRFKKEFGQAPGADQRILARSATQFGTLGSGNHFAEVSSDADGAVWLVVHSGSRGPGNMLAQKHINAAREWGKANGEKPENKDLYPLIEGTDEFDAYIADMLWAQSFALWQRRAMMDRMLEAVAEEAEYAILDDIDCHHNYSEKQSDGSWLSRKGAIDASEGVKGVIPGSMGALSYIVAGKGNLDSYNTAPHGAGRLKSRGAARRELDIDEFKAQMGDRVWQDRDAKNLLDEAPDAYKPIDVVMEDAKDLVEAKYELTQFINFKGL